ncbi:MAG: hypothetical protein EOO01_03710 [Chitinophagaceae bacterium]|nr:MAG: hypothetical protein EOO01_03710 [Chitinophagaceae bacterium]
MFKKLMQTAILVCSSLISHAQFNADTLATIEVNGVRTTKKPDFSTFTNKLSLNSTHVTFLNHQADSISRDFVLPVAIRVQNTKGVKLRLDSMLIKSTRIDTGKLIFTLNVYSANKLFSAATATFTNIRGNVATVLFDRQIYLPIETCYLGFSYVTRDHYNFALYTSRKFPGYIYYYSKDRDEFGLTPFEDNPPPISCPQVKLYYTKLLD